MSVPLLPAASSAVTVITFVPADRTTRATLQLVVPLVKPVPPRLLAHVTDVTPRSSDDEPPRVRSGDVVEYVDDDVGPRMETTGAFVSGGVYVTVSTSVFTFDAA